MNMIHNPFSETWMETIHPKRQKVRKKHKIIKSKKIEDLDKAGKSPPRYDSDLAIDQSTPDIEEILQGMDEIAKRHGLWALASVIDMFRENGGG